jgi:HlyD family secretion protein
MRRESTRDHASRRWVVGALAAMAVLLGAGLAVARRMDVVRAEPVNPLPERHNLSGVGCMGRVEPASRVRRLAPPESQGLVTLESLAVAEGDRVERDQLLGLFSVHSARAAALRQAEADLVRSEAQLALVEAGAKRGDVSAAEARVNRQRAAEANARAELDRAVQLAAEKIVATTELDARRTALAVALAERRAAEQELASVAEVRRVDVAVAEAGVEQARAAVERSRAELALAELRAPIAGTVLKIHTWPGERIDERGVLDLADLADIHVVAEVYETDVPRVQVGQPAEVLLPGGSERLKGTVVALGWQVRKREIVNTDPVDEIDSRVVEVRVHVHPEDAPRLARLSHMRVQLVIGG